MGESALLPLPILFYGGTGQAKVNREILLASGRVLSAVVDDTPDLPPPFGDVPLLAGWAGLLSWRGTFEGDFLFSVAIGNPHAAARLEIARRLESIGGRPTTLIHPSAVIASDVAIGEGCQIMAGAILQPGTTLGRHCIVNTRASVDHECSLADGAEIGPGATLCGSIRVETGAWVCAGATILPRLRIGVHSIVGAGAVAISDVADGAVVAGVPACPIRTTMHPSRPPQCNSPKETPP